MSYDSRPDRPEAAARMIVGMSAEIVQLRETLACAYETLSAFHMVTGLEDPYPFKPGGALRHQAAVDIAVIEEVLAMAPEDIIAMADAETSEET